MRSHRLFPVVAPAIVLLFLLGARQGASQSASDFTTVKGMDERFRLDLGGFFQSFETTIRVDSAEYGLGTEIALEDDLGLDSNQANFRADGYWRFGRHGRLDFSYTGWNRRAERVIDRDITIDDTVYHAGATLDSRLRVSLAELYYGYSFWNTPRFEAGVQLGATVLFNKVNFDGSGTISSPDGSASGSVSSESRSLVAPVPAIGIQARYTIVPRLLVSGRIRGMGVTIDNIKGSVQEGRVALDYYPWKNVGFGAAYDYMDIKVTKVNDPTVEFEYEYSGPMAYLSLVF